eukprot:15447355-Alexandrium_andersonii.AAC.1
MKWLQHTAGPQGETSMLSTGGDSYDSEQPIGQNREGAAPSYEVAAAHSSRDPTPCLFISSLFKFQLVE